MTIVQLRALRTEAHINRLRSRAACSSAAAARAQQQPTLRCGARGRAPDDILEHVAPQRGSRVWRQQRPLAHRSLAQRHCRLAVRRARQGPPRRAGCRRRSRASGRHAAAYVQGCVSAMRGRDGRRSSRATAGARARAWKRACRLRECCRMCWQAATGRCELRKASSVASACGRVAGCCAARAAGAGRQLVGLKQCYKYTSARVCIQCRQTFRQAAPAASRELSRSMVNAKVHVTLPYTQAHTLKGCQYAEQH